MNKFVYVFTYGKLYAVTLLSHYLWHDVVSLIRAAVFASLTD